MDELKYDSSGVRTQEEIRRDEGLELFNSTTDYLAPPQPDTQDNEQQAQPEQPNQPPQQQQQPPQQQPPAAVQPPTSSGEWAQRLNSDRAGAAGDAEAFTKQFMKQLPGGQPHHGAQPSPMGLKPGPVPPPQAPGDWSRKLGADKAGMATNAEDFTKEFMKQLTGGQ